MEPCDVCGIAAPCCMCCREPGFGGDPEACRHCQECGQWGCEGACGLSQAEAEAEAALVEGDQLVESEMRSRFVDDDVPF